MYILIAILMFGVLVAIHEFGHFIVAKACKVKVNEFAIGMGPALLKKQGKETLYSLRLLPIGGFCAMEGEDEASNDPRAFTSQPAWKRFFILLAGSGMNFLLGLLIVLIIFLNAQGFVGNTVTGFLDGFPLEGENGLMVGDKIVAIDGHRVFYSDDFSTYMSRTGETVDLTVIRDGEKLTLKDLPLVPREYQVDGETQVKYGITFNVIQATFGEKLKYSLYTAYDFVRLVWMGLSDLVSGAVGLNDLAGPVGIVSTINDVGQSAESTAAGLLNVAYLSAFIAVNLAVMNLLPIPALDGGRIFFLLVTWVVEKIIRRRVNPKYEGYIHGAGLVLLLGFMAVVMINDIVRLVR